MFDTNKIYNENQRFRCSCSVKSHDIAQEIQAKYIDIARTMNLTGEISINGNNVTVDTSDLNDTRMIATYINLNYFTPELHVFVFYGQNKRGIQDRWCVGFDYPPNQVTQIIDHLNMTNQFINADKKPEDWYDKNNKSYSVVMLSNAYNTDTEDEINKRIKMCLVAIQETTSRRLTIHQV